MLRLRGVAQVAIFNWPKIVGGLATVGAGVLGWRRIPLLGRLVVLGAAFWTPVSLVASWWVYDQSPLRRWRFVADGLARVPDRVLLVVAGFDEVSPALVEQWPHARIEVVDVVAEPEASVRRARRWYPADAPVVSPAALAAPDSYDLVLFAQSAHEIRDPAQRAALFGAAQRALTEDGRVVLVEHLRDLANFVAFGPGWWHFTDRRTWLDTFRRAALDVVGHQRITPLVHCWTLAR